MVRQLTAIMFTDMVGYSALMQEDEALASRNRDRQRAILEQSVSAHGGRVLQFYGDATLSVFHSAVAIGIHSGDVVHDESEVFGDGVSDRVPSSTVPFTMTSFSRSQTNDWFPSFRIAERGTTSAESSVSVMMRPVANNGPDTLRA